MTMTEIRPTKKIGAVVCVGLFATSDFQVGDVILTEKEPLIHVSSSSMTSEEEKELLSCFLFSTANHHHHHPPLSSPAPQPPSSFQEAIMSIDIPKEVEDRDHGKFRGLVQAGAWYLVTKVSSEAKAKLLKLYHPSLDHTTTTTTPEEQDLVKLAQSALQYLKKSCKESSKIGKSLLSDDDAGDGNVDDADTKVSCSEEEVLKVMLIWACNAFDGGRIYALQSRINHSCDPNAVVQVLVGGDNGGGGGQVVRAAAPIAAGDEITISYLGTLLYGDSALRQDELRHSKYFNCRCERCNSNKPPNFAASIPCLWCHPRETRLMMKSSLQLDEDVQYDDDHTVHYMYPPATALGNDNGCTLFECESCHNSFSSSEYSNVFVTVKSISSSVAAYLRSRATTGSTLKKPQQHEPGEDNKDIDDDDDDDATAAVVLEEQLTLASSVLGARHWTTNLLLLLQLDHLLQTYHAQLLQGGDSDDNGGMLDTIAQGIDMLERICRYVDGLDLKLHRGHLLSQVIIGVARALVSLGDVKSCTYAREWLDKIDDDKDGYVEKFESEGIQKVVATLKEAHHKKRGGSTTSQKEVKKLKT